MEALKYSFGILGLLGLLKALKATVVKKDY
jgi:hypothetical protein